MVQVNALEAQERLLQLLDMANSGEDVVITYPGRRRIRLVVVESDQEQAVGGNGSAFVDWLEAHRLPDEMYRSTEDIERSIQEERDAWE